MTAFRFGFGEERATGSSGAASPCGQGPLEIHLDASPSSSTRPGDDEALVVDVEGLTFDLGVSSTASLVVPGVYEGGREIWECALDLARFLERTEPRLCAGRRAIELGCGRGLLGLWAIRHGATEVTFCDYNDDVLRDVTAPLARKELDRTPHGPRVRLLAGDWDALSGPSSTAETETFDVVLTAETTYRADLARKLGRTIGVHLAPEGLAFVATKRYYFGTGGGSRALVESLPEGLQADRVWVADDGASNIRDIYRLSWQQKSELP